jgi:HEAT repeat protein
MRRTSFGATVLGVVIAASALLGGSEAKSDSTNNGGGVGAVYGNIPPDQVEFLSSQDRIMSVAAGNVGASAIWETLEHGEAVECLQCIPAVEGLMYDQNAETREIAAWWLRKRIFGVFGKGEAYERTLGVLANDPNPQRRAYAAEAIGEFLTLAGAAPLAKAATTDPAPNVRAAAVKALGRLNDDGAGAISAAMKDPDESVKVAALASAGRINSFVDAAAPASALGDASPKVRVRAVELLDSMRARDALASIANLAKNDPDRDVRLAACHALGTFGDPAARPTLESVYASDPDTLVRDQARIALRRL